MMVENQSISKKGRMGFQPGRDRLSELPLSIIHIILALMPIRDAVKTSILSRQWRYTWATLPHLVFKERYPIQDYDEPRDEYEDYVENFITHALVLHKGPIHKFKLSVLFEKNCRSIGVWLLCLSRKDIRELIIKNYYGWVHELRSSIYYCKKLTKLELVNCKLDPPPTTFTTFLFLRCLFLRKVDLSTAKVESLVANCPLLEEFTSIECGSSELRISAPNLKVLDLRDEYIEMSVYAPLLAELSVELPEDGFTDHHQQQDSSVCNYTDFLGGFTNLEKLSGELYFTRYLSTGIESCHRTLLFHRLKEIDLNEVHFQDMNEISLVARLIVGAPNLELLEIANVSYTLLEDDDAPEDCQVSFSDFGCAPDFKFEKLRVVNMRGIIVINLPQMEIIRFLLERSPVLETMNFDIVCDEGKQNLGARLEGCNQASPNIKFTY